MGLGCEQLLNFYDRGVHVYVIDRQTVNTAKRCCCEYYKASFKSRIWPSRSAAMLRRVWRQEQATRDGNKGFLRRVASE